MSKKLKSKTKTNITSIVMLLSFWGINDISARYFTEWNNHMGILAFVFKIIIVVLIGLIITLLTNRKVVEENNDTYEIEVKDERNVMLRSKAALSMWKINLVLLVAIMLVMIAIKTAVAAWCILLLIAINLIGLCVCFSIEDKKY